MERIRYNIEDIYNQYNITNKITDLVELLDLLKLNKSNIKYLIKIDTYSNVCNNEKCRRMSCYYDIINKNHICWFHAYSNNSR